MKNPYLIQKPELMTIEKARHGVLELLKLLECFETTPQLLDFIKNLRNPQDQDFSTLPIDTDLRYSHLGQRRTLYSLRHSAITFRLPYGKNIDLLTLARNARTSAEMIDKFYASELTAEMNVDMLHSRR
jgi:hypothetical protein